MEQNSYLRLALMLADNNSNTFNQNLEMMIKLVLHDEGCGEKLDVIGIIERLKDKYGLSFTDGEIINVVGKKHTKIICLDTTKPHGERQYTISPEEYKKIDQRLNSSIFDDVTRGFLSSNTDITLSEDQFKKLWMRYMYSVFNTNTEAIHKLLSGGKDAELEGPDNFSTEEKGIINTFIFWEDVKKDKCVYQMVSCGFDYCMMTLRQNNSTYKDIFKNKTFLLDTNIVFRLMGLNQEGRQKLIREFIDKCNDVGIQVSYTNITKAEILDTINYHVNNIQRLLNGQEPVETKAVYCMNPYAVNEGFYQAYVDWCKKPHNTIGDFPSFELDLKREAEEILSEFRITLVDDFVKRNPKDYKENNDSLTEFKSSRYRKFSEETIKADVLNYMKVWELNRGSNLADFFNTKYYIISADHAYCDWIKEKYPAVIPVIVLPSVWYSIILRYSSRTDDDASSFTRFLYFSLGNNEEIDPKKKEILDYVMDELQDSAKIKARTLYEINNRLQNGEIDMDSSVEAIVTDAHNFITEQEVAKVREEEAQKYKAKAEELKGQYNQGLQTLKNQQEVELNRVNAENYKLQLENAKALKAAQDESEEALINQKKETAEKLAKSSLHATIIKYWIFTLILIAIFLALVYLAYRYISNIPLQQMTASRQMGLTFLFGAFPIAVGILEVIVWKVGLCALDKDKVRKRLEEKYVKKIEGR